MKINQIKTSAINRKKVSEDGKVVHDANTTPDVKTGEIRRQAAKFGNKINSKNEPPLLNTKAHKNTSPHVLSNLGLTEAAIDVTAFGVDATVSETDDMIVLDQVKARDRGTGAGTKYMQKLTQYADSVGKPITLIPSNSLGGSIARLKKFYQRVGFVAHNASGKRYEMIRYPKEKMTETKTLTELFDKTHTWRWTSTTPTRIKAEFDAADGATVTVVFNSSSPKSTHYEVAFIKNDSMQRSGEGDQFAILSTVMDVINGFMDKNPTAESIGFIAKREGLAATHRKYRDSRVSLYKRMLTSVAKANNLEIAWEEVGRMTEFILRREVPATVDEGIEILNNPKNDKFGIDIGRYKPEGGVIGKVGPYELWLTNDHTKSLSPMAQIWNPKLTNMVGIIELDAMSHREFAPKTFVAKMAVVNDDYAGKGIVFKGYIALLKLGYSLLSDEDQTAGGMKIWGKLAKTAGINVYAVSNLNRDIQFSSVDPDDLTDADFAVYNTDEGRKLKQEWLELYSDYEELHHDISLQDKERKDGRGLPQDEYDGMVDHAKMIKRELDVTKREYDAVSKSEQVGAFARLMATTSAGISESVTETPQINEVFDQPYDWHWKIEPDTINASSRADFNTHDGRPVHVGFDENDDVHSVDFDTNYSFNATDEGDQFRIFATVMQIISEYAKRVDPAVIIFSADKNQRTNSTSRIKLYKRMVTKFAQQINMNFKFDDGMNGTMFKLTKTNMNEAVKKPRPEDTLGYKRHEMPQVHKRHYPELFKYLADNGGKMIKGSVAATSLKAVQSEFSDDGIEKMMRNGGITGDGTKKPLLVSSDNYIIDGHHRWLAAWNQKETVPIIKISIPVNELLQLVQDFKHTTYRSIYNENMSITGTERHEQEREKNLEPGTEAWFAHWFSLPKMTREDLDYCKEEVTKLVNDKKGAQNGKTSTNRRVNCNRGTDE